MLGSVSCTERRLREGLKTEALGFTILQVSTVRVGGMRFKVYPQDHEPRHVHALIGAGEVVIDLRADGTVALAARASGAIRGSVSRNEVRKALAAAAGAFDRLAKAWEDMHDGEER